jgi:hypothetical protein
MVAPISTRRLCYEILKVDKDELLALVADADSFYKVRIVPKLHPDGTPKRNADGTPAIRTLEPSYEYMKVVQRRIDKKILKPAMDTLPPEIMGGRPGVSVIDNANLHSQSRALMKYDVKNFFPSITYRHIYNIFRYRLNFGEEAANILTKLTTYPADNPHVPQGAPTSTSLAMFALEPLATKLSQYTRINNMQCSFWVDDITISGDASVLGEHRGHINNLVNSTPYRIHPDKDTGIIKKGSIIVKDGKVKEKGRKITGITVDNTNSLTLGHDKLKSLKRRVARIQAPSEKLLGSLQFLKQVSPSKGRPLLHEYKKRLAAKDKPKGSSVL